MKYFNLGLLAFFFFLFSSTTINHNKRVEVSYTSVSSSMTKIKLNMYSNGKFALVINIFGDKIPATKSRGRWYKRNGNYVLTFKKRSNPTLRALFPNDLSNQNVSIVDDETFKFQINSAELLIYGVKCKRGNTARA